MDTPRVASRVENEYLFQGPGGAVSLAELFERRRRLIVYHFPFDPAWDGDCGTASHLAQGLAGGIVNLPARDTAFAAVSGAPIERIESCRRRMGWTFPWVSSAGNTFNEDFGVASDGVSAGSAAKGELPGLSVFRREGTGIFHTYTTYQRNLDVLLGSYRSPELARRGVTRFPPRQASR